MARLYGDFCQAKLSYPSSIECGGGTDCCKGAMPCAPTNVLPYFIYLKNAVFFFFESKDFRHAELELIVILTR
jgi:hypothetical protein